MPNKMTLTDFWVEVGRQHQLHKNWRWGQTLFNTLVTHRPDISEVIRATPNDPFYVDSTFAPQYMAAVEVLTLMWDEGNQNED